MVRGIFFFTISTSIFTEIFTIFPYDFDIASPMGCVSHWQGFGFSAWACIRQSFCEDFAGLARVLKA